MTYFFQYTTGLGNDHLIVALDLLFCLVSFIIPHSPKQKLFFSDTLAILHTKINILEGEKQLETNYKLSVIRVTNYKIIKYKIYICCWVKRKIMTSYTKRSKE